MSEQHVLQPVIWIHEAEELEHLRTGLVSYCRLGADSNYCWNTTNAMHIPKHLVPLYDKSAVDALEQQLDELQAKYNQLKASAKKVIGEADWVADMDIDTQNAIYEMEKLLEVARKTVNSGETYELEKFLKDREHDQIIDACEVIKHESK